MNHAPRVVIGLLALLSCCVSAVADLGSEIRTILSDKALARAQVGVEIIRLTEGRPAQVLFQHNASQPLLPASNMKLVTTSAALEHLGTDFRFRTVLLRRGSDLCIVGDGDPTFGDTDLLRAAGWGVDTVYRNWANLLKQRGITSVRNVLVDDSVFDENFLHPNWPADQAHFRYVAQVGGMNLNINTVDFFLQTRGVGQVVDYRTDPPTAYINVNNSCVQGHENAVWLTRDPGTNNITLRGQTNARMEQKVTVTIHDPPMFAVTVLAETLQAQGVQVTGQVMRDRTIRASLLERPGTLGDTWIPIAIHETPMAVVLARSNKDSVNLYAESLTKRIGHTVTRESGSWENGLAATAKFLESIGIAPSEFTLSDGSGLSRGNAISANAMARVLAHRWASPARQAFLDSLAVAGFDGTMDSRFRDTNLRGRVRAKSGYIRGVSALSGYVEARDGHTYAFAILMNNVGDIATCKVLQERIVRAIDTHATATATAR